MLRPQDQMASLLFQFGQALGTHITLSPQGAVTLEFAGDVACTIEVPENGRHIHCHARIFGDDMPMSPTLLEAALSCNLGDLAHAEIETP